MAVRAGAPKPDISSLDALKRALLQAKSIALSPQVSGVYLSTELFPRLGIAAQMKVKTIVVERERVGEVVARGDAEIGFQQISELLPVKGLDYVGPLPPEVQRLTTFSAGIASHASNPTGGRALIAFFTSPEGLRAMRKYGLSQSSRGNPPGTIHRIRVYDAGNPGACRTFSACSKCRLSCFDVTSNPVPTLKRSSGMNGFLKRMRLTSWAAARLTRSRIWRLPLRNRSRIDGSTRDKTGLIFRGARVRRVCGDGAM